MIPIGDPFKTAIDVTTETPFDELPKSYCAATRERLRAEIQDDKALRTGIEPLSQDTYSEQFLLNEIHRTVSHYDDHVVNVAFHAALSAYSKPLNLALKAESGSGKSYSTTQTVLFMPQEDVMYIASQSPKVISHENGKRKTADGRDFDSVPEPQKPERSDYPDDSEYKALLDMYREEVKAYRKLQDESYYEVDLRNKIIVFLEGVNTETLKMLKTTMSHDNEENGWIDHKYVDDRGKVHVTRLVGAPTLIFNSQDNEYVSEFATRCLTATPSTTKDKIAAAMEISNRKSSYPWEYERENFNRRLIQEYIRRIRDTMQKGKINVVNPFITIQEAFTKDQTRAMRDFNKYIELIAPFAMFKLFQRPIIIVAGKRYLVPSVEDALNAKAAFDAVLQTTQTGTEQRIISFYYEVASTHEDGATTEELATEYNRDRKKPLTVRRIREYLERLVEIEWVDEREDQHTKDSGYVDRRFKTYVPLKKCVNAAILETAVDLKAILENSFETWLKTIAEIPSFHSQIIIPKIDGSAYQITVQEMTQVVLGKMENISAIVSEVIPSSLGENKAESVAVLEIAPLAHILPSNNPHQCDGSTKDGLECPFEAKFTLKYVDNPEVGYFCPECYTRVRKSSLENGFQLEP